MAIALPVYPRTDIDQPAKLIARLGTFWTKIFQDRALLTQLYTGRNMMFEQTNINYCEASEGIARRLIPVLHTEQWHRVLLQTDNISVHGDRPLLYQPDAAKYGEPGDVAPFNRVFNYGDSLTGTNFAFPIAADLKHITVLCNRIDSPTITLVRGVDFDIDEENEILILNFNPFSNPDISTREVYDAEGVIGFESQLWGFITKFDTDNIWTYFGYALPLRLASSQLYKDLMNAVYDMHVIGAHAGGLDSVLSAALGVPLIATDGEIIEEVLTARKLQIITNKRTYKFNSDSTVLITVGDTVNRGDRLVDTFEIVHVSGEHLDLGATNIQQHEVTERDIKTNNGQWDPPGVTIPIKTYATQAAITDFHGREGANKYLGNQTATYLQTRLPAHESVSVGIDILLVGDGWTGNFGDTRIKIELAGEVLLDETFSNNPDHTQSFPEPESPAKTGSKSDNLSFHNYSVYRFDFSRAHVDDSLEFKVTVSGLDEARVDGWSVFYIGDSGASGFINIGDPVSAHIERYKGFFGTLEALGSFASTVAIPSLNIFLANWLEFQRIAAINPLCRFPRSGFLVEDFFGNLVNATGSQICIVSGGDSIPPSGNDLAVNAAVDIINRSGTYIAYTNAGWALGDLEITLFSREIGPIETRKPFTLTTFPGIAGITLDNSYLIGTFFNGLHFPNKDVELEYTLDDDGRAEVRFEISGFPGDIDRFWELVRERGKAQGFTLAQLLDTRADPFGDPAETDVPEIINPMIFVLRHFLQYNIFFVNVRAGLEAEGALLNDALRQLRDTLQPHVNYFLFTELVVPEEVIDLIWTEEITVGAGPIIEESWGPDPLVIDAAPFVGGVEGVIASC